jgi:DNA mismatch repair protein MutS
VSAFLKDQDTSEKLRLHLNKIGDIERLMAKIATQKISPRELILLQQSLEESVALKKLLEESSENELKAKAQQLPPCTQLRETIAKTLKEDAPVATSKGNFIADGYSADLDELRVLLNSGKAHLDAMLERETEATGIPSLKIAFNNVFGYYIEVRNTHKDKAPERWTRKQTLVNAERYITEELKEYESATSRFSPKKSGGIETECGCFGANRLLTKLCILGRKTQLLLPTINGGYHIAHFRRTAPGH